MTTARRAHSNFALQHALWHGEQLGKPVLVFEPLRVGYQWASERIHRFVLDGMAVNASRFGRGGVTYYPYVEPRDGEGKGLLRALASRAAIVVTDEYPAFFIPRMVEAAAARITTRLETVDSNGILPLRASERPHVTAASFRRTLQKKLRPHLETFPVAEPMALARLVGRARIPEETLRRWPAASMSVLESGYDLALMPIDHSVRAVSRGGGSVAAEVRLAEFLEENLAWYEEDRNQPQRDVSSGLSAYLHFGHIGAHQVVSTLMEHEAWEVGDAAPRATGKRSGWWGMSASAEAFLDQVITWRELGYTFCFHVPEYDRFDALPAWAVATLNEHRADPRPYTYDHDTLERGATHDPLWNAAQGQLREEGMIHNYLRMLWGKKILEWSASPEEALHSMVELNNRYALDGRDPNSYSGIFWTLGRFDRAWGPERPVFGKVRYMTSRNTARKYRVRDYIARYTREGLAAG